MVKTSVMRPRVSMVGATAVLLDLGRREFDDEVQRRIWAVCTKLRAVAGVLEAVPAMNNAMVVFDPLQVAPASVESALLETWEAGAVEDPHGEEVVVPVVYGGAAGEDLPELAARCGLSIQEVIERHASAVYSVAAIGAMPGFPYLSGLDPKLACARRANPRVALAEGAVIIGGAQASILPRRGPSGWHVIGHTDFKLFDVRRAPPAIFRAGDKVRFKAIRVES